MSKIIAYTALLYGKDYLAAAMLSVLDSVDEFWILYALHGSHGTQTNVPCPDTRDDLYAIASAVAGNKLRWVEGNWHTEGEQRDSIHQLVPDADVVLVVDSDEVWADGLADDAIVFALDSGAKRIRLPFTHLWRSFARGFAHDPAYPERVIVPKHIGATITMPTEKRVWHFGYAQRSEIVRWKTLVHGHRNEFRRDVRWFEEVFATNRQYDCHIVGSEYWNCEDIDLRGLPSMLEYHPYRHLEVIP